MNEERITRNIKLLRQKHKITLEQLATLTGLTKGYLSKVERSRKAPPYSTLNKIALAFGVDPTSLLGERLGASRDVKLAFTKRDGGRVIRSAGALSEGSLYRYEYEALAFDKRGKNMEPYILTPSFDEEAVFQHDGEEFMFVLEGKHELVYGGEKYLMEKGDSVYFDASIPHSGRSIGKKRAKLLAVMFNYKRLPLLSV